MDTFDVQHVPALLRLTYRVLAMRILVYVALVMTAGLFCWALAAGTWQALATSGTFAVFVFLPILYRCARKEDSDGQDA
jgi:hypothetical protein